MHDTLENVNDSTVSGLGRLARFFGFGEVMGRLYGTLLLSPEPLSLDERIADLQGFFQFAQLALQAVLGNSKSLDFDAVTRIEIE